MYNEIKIGNREKEGTAKALKQIEDKKYETELLEKGIKNIVKLAIVFKGKNVKVAQGIIG